MTNKVGHVLFFALLFIPSLASAVELEWSHTELHFQYGDLAIPAYAGGGDAEHFVYTVQHASGWTYGDNYFFVDTMDAQDTDFQDFDIYGEWYTTLSFKKMTGHTFTRWPIADMGLILGFAWAKKGEWRKYLPGVRVALDLPGFRFANLDFMAFLDDSAGAGPPDRAPRESHSFQINFNFIRPFTIAGLQFSIEGYGEYVGARVNEFGHGVGPWFLMQPQFRWHPTDWLALGIEWQYWTHKLGDRGTDENVPQLLIVWKF